MGRISTNPTLIMERINCEARAWFIKIHYGENDPAQQHMFENWLSEHNDHQKSYKEICAFMQKTEEYTSDPLCRERYKNLLLKESDYQEKSVENIIAFKQPSQKTPVFCRKFFLQTVAASLFLVLGIAFFIQAFFMGDSYQTAIGEQKTVSLADGSIVKLNTNSKVTVDFTAGIRSVTLDHGQAYLIVAKNPSRPFIVNFGVGSVTAIGTEFEVYKKGPKVVVSLVEGKVKVHGSSLKAVDKQVQEAKHEPEEIVMVADTGLDTGEQISFSPQHISPVIKTDNKRINAWQRKQLIFRKVSLDQVISEINCYSTRKIILAQPLLGNKIISGIFPIDSVEAISIINKYFGLTKSINEHDEIILAKFNQLHLANQ